MRHLITNSAKLFNACKEQFAGRIDHGELNEAKASADWPERVWCRALMVLCCDAGFGR